MIKPIIIIALFTIQIFLIMNGVLVFDKLLHPFLLAVVSLGIPIIYRSTIPYNPATINNRTNGYIGFVVGVLSIAICIPSLHKIFLSIPDPSTGSDIIPQLETLYRRFSNGTFPYYPLEQFEWHPYPVYMPLHWLPLGLAYLLHIDIRWVGIIIFAIASGIWGYYVWKKNTGILQKLIATFLPAIVLYCYIKWDAFAMGVSYEMIIAGYYLVLAIGLASRNFALTTIGIILCLLSRYTMLFWLPLFLILSWNNVSKQKNILMWCSIFIAILCIYVIPFYFKDPSILSKGIAYHNACYYNEWNGLGNPANSTAFDGGLNFSYFICHSLTGDMERRVFWARIIQGLVMSGTLISGLLLYKRWKYKMSHYDFSLMMLYSFMLLFYLFSPLTYKTYYIPVQIIAAALCGQVICRSKRTFQHNS